MFEGEHKVRPYNVVTSTIPFGRNHDQGLFFEYIHITQYSSFFLQTSAGTRSHALRALPISFAISVLKYVELKYSFTTISQCHFLPCNIKRQL